MSWRRFFRNHRVPTEIEKLVKAGILKDETTKNDYVPRFETRFADGSEVVLWVNHPTPSRRAIPDVSRFELRLHEPGRNVVTLLETEKVEELLAGLRQLFLEKGRPRIV